MTEGDNIFRRWVRLKHEAKATAQQAEAVSTATEVATEKPGIDAAMQEPFDPASLPSIGCEVMAGLADGSIPARPGAEREFFQEHLSPWIGRFFFDLEHAEAADFYATVGLLGRTFVAIEAEAFSRSA